MDEDRIINQMRELHERAPLGAVDAQRQLELGRQARRRSLYSRSLGAAGLVVAVAVGAFFMIGNYRSADPGPAAPPSDAAEDALAIAEAYAIAPTTLEVNVSSCNGEPVVESLIETDEEVRLLIVSTRPPSSNECLDTVTVELRAPLGDRRLVDARSGETVPMG